VFGVWTWSRRPLSSAPTRPSRSRTFSRLLPAGTAVEDPRRARRHREPFRAQDRLRSASRAAAATRCAPCW
jgi:hypothetical protein